MNTLNSSASKKANCGDGAGSHRHLNQLTNERIDQREVEVITTRAFINMRLLACLPLAVGMSVAIGLGDAQSAPRRPTEFEESTIVVERNATDGDTEVVMTALGGDEGLRHLVIRTPDARRVLLLSSRDPTIMGIREFAFESPEPEGDAILAAYPEGTYMFHGVSVAGERFKGEAELSHQLPEPTVITNPVQGAVVEPDSLTIQWSAVPGIAEYVVEFENESTDPEQILTVNVPANSTSFEVPNSLVTPGNDYQVGIATVGASGNVVVTETTFSTAGH
jgi:hypothetical protein